MSKEAYELIKFQFRFGSINSEVTAHEMTWGADFNSALVRLIVWTKMKPYI